MLKNIMLAQAERMGIPMRETQAEAFARYHGLLVETNKKFNLTRVPDEIAEAADRNYLDCIAALKAADIAAARAVCDIGSGAGFPGIPLSIMCPDTHFVLVDALGKRVNFLRDVIEALGLNAEAVHMRAEDAAHRKELREHFDFAVARAVAPMNVLCEYLLPFVRVGGGMVALKGPGAAEETAQAANALRVLGARFEGVTPIEIPGRDWSHCAVVLRKTAATPKQYPRKAGTPERSPL